jgi:L-aspartate oxidase
LRLKTDILVIGSGIAGLSFALKASAYANVIIITKKEKAESNTNYAQGGVASVMAENDNFDLHIKDTLACGAGLCHREAVEEIVTEGPKLINELIKLGVDFSKHDGNLDLGKEGGHSRSRIVHSKDLTGKEIEHALLHNVSIKKNITLLEHHCAVELITEHHLKTKKSFNGKNTSCYGAYVYDEQKNEIFVVKSKITVICSGGIGQVYLHTTNPEIATGDGIAMAFRSGCKTANMEFVQFHPTSLYEPNPENKNQAFLISEALRGAGGILRNKAGEAFMEKYDKAGSLAPRDIVARAIDNEMKKSGDECVYLDMTSLSDSVLMNKFPNIYKKCLQIGINISKDYIPVVPAAHYICGGIVTGLNGRASVNNLYALGEAAMTGVHGANRLASNSLLEALVFADTASKDCRELFTKKGVIKKIKIRDIPSWDDSGTVNAEEWILISQNRTEIKQIMSNYVGIVRSNLRLNRALRRIKLIKKETENFYKKTKVTRELIELINMALIAFLIIRSALKRKESRGLHYSTDYPNTSRKYLKDTIISNNVI